LALLLLQEELLLGVAVVGGREDVDAVEGLVDRFEGAEGPAEAEAMMPLDAMGGEEAETVEGAGGADIAGEGAAAGFADACEPVPVETLSLIRGLGFALMGAGARN
jgi:hypothetical protein